MCTFLPSETTFQSEKQTNQYQNSLHESEKELSKLSDKGITNTAGSVFPTTPIAENLSEHQQSQWEQTALNDALWKA